MPRRTDQASVLVVGASQIVVGQAYKLDYSDVQAESATRRVLYRQDAIGIECTIAAASS